MARKIRSDSTVESLAKNHGIPEDLIRHSNGRKVRKDATVKALRNAESEKAKKTEKK
jgi:hypothetical protein